MTAEFSEDKYKLAHHKYLIENLRVQLDVTFNKDPNNPAMPATQKHPQIVGDVIIGGKCSNYSGDGKQNDAAASSSGPAAPMKFSLYQPQMLRILKTLEIIGFYNEFKEAALKQFRDAKLDQGK